jgi:hypothetical protein
MNTGVEVYLKARELVDTPYLHQGRLAGIAIDCIGVPIWVASELRLGDFDKSDYPRAPDGSMVELITSVCSNEIIQAGVLLVFEIGGVAQHCGIVSIYQNGLGLIHAWDIAGKVCEHRLTQDWINKVVGCYGLPGVVYNG